MKAIGYEKFGLAAKVLKVQEIELQKPIRQEVVIKLKYSGVNPSDAKARAGNRPGVSKPECDLVIPHSDGSGVIKEVGSGLDQSLISKRVWVRNGQWKRPMEQQQNILRYP